MLELLQNCFTWKGRLGRADFCAGMLGLGIVVTAFMGVFWADIYFHKTPTFFGMGVPGFFVLFFLLWFLGVFIEISLFIRRLHDLGLPESRPCTSSFLSWAFISWSCSSSSKEWKARKRRRFSHEIPPPRDLGF